MGDLSGVTIIPTPRANPHSLPGIYPRPVHSSHPDFNRVCTLFRMLGRLFASALRDGFLIPLPLSLEFIKLVQQSDFPAPDATRVTFVDDAMSMSGSSNESMEDAVPKEVADDDDLILSSEDLPRPGF